LLQYFLIVAEELHVGRAAERLHMTQQPLSAAVRRLEASIGVELFVREANRIRLTDAGAALVDDAREILARIEAAAVRARRIARGETGTLRIGYCTAAMRRTIPAVAAYFRTHAPDVTLDLAQLTQREQLERLDRGELDIACVHRPVDERGRDVRAIAQDRLVVALPIDHPLASNDTVRPASIANTIGASFRPDEYPEFLAVVDAAFGDDPVTPTSFARDRASLLGLVASGAGCAVLTESAALAERRPDVAILTLQTPIVLEYVAVWNMRSADAGPIRHFRDALLALASTANDAARASAVSAA